MVILYKPLDKKYFKNRRQHDVDILLQMSSIRTIQILQQLELNRPKDDCTERHPQLYELAYDTEESEDLEDSGENVYYEE